MSKPISYYLSSDPPFPLESIERCSVDERIGAAHGLLDLACLGFEGKKRKYSALIRVAAAFKTSLDSINSMTFNEKIQLAAAILMVATDDLELLQPENLIV
jgi:hypothetical protein